MALDVGARLGPYEILGPLGSGGMGDVDRALDTRLKRIVAIKVAKTNAFFSSAQSDASASTVIWPAAMFSPTSPAPPSASSSACRFL